MLDKNGIVKRLTLANVSAKRELQILKGLENPGLFDYQEHIYRYVIYKFLLDDEPDIVTKDMNELAKLSVEKAGKLNPNELTLLDVSKHCGATSSFMTKKVLLFMALSEDIGMHLAKYNTADIENTDMLAEIIFSETQKKKMAETDITGDTGDEFI